MFHCWMCADVANLADICHYHYDPLNRLVGRTCNAQMTALLFYSGVQTATELHGSEQLRILRANDRLLAIQRHANNLLQDALLVTDQQASVLSALFPGNQQSLAYTAYGHRPALDELLPGMPGFNGEHLDPITCHYHLGNGYRAYNPVLMRFNSPDNLSPFGKGGLNPYAYCQGDPVNRKDPSGHELATQLMSYAYVGLGFLGAVWGLKLAKPALKTVMKGGATVAQKLGAAAAVTQVVASTTFIVNRVVNAVDPDSPVLKPLMGIVLVGAAAALSMRVGSFYVGKHAAKTLVGAGPASSAPSRNSSIRSTSSVQITRL